jgi:hypothetical protein
MSAREFLEAVITNLGRLLEMPEVSGSEADTIRGIIANLQREKSEQA